MTERSWWGLALLWFLGVLYGWTAFFEHRTTEADRAALEAQWRITFDSLNAPVDSEKLALPIPIDTKQLKADVHALSFPRSSPNDRRAARKIISHRLAALGYGPQQHAFQNGVNVFADRKGTGMSDEYVIVAAHYDTVADSPGADDNATGVAIVLEMARLFAETPPKTGLRFVFFDREENQMQGSKAFAMDAERVKNVRGVLVLEMLGATCHTEGCQEWPKHSPKWMRTESKNFIAAVGLLEKTELTRAVVRAQKNELPPVLAIPVPNQGMDWPNARRSDHAVFWDRNIDAVMLTDTGNFRNPRYHTRDDTAETIDWDYLAGAAEITHRTLRLITHPELFR